MNRRSEYSDMSFCQDVKSELGQIVNDEADALAEAYGLLLFGRSFSVTGMSLLTENAAAAARYAAAVRLLCGRDAQTGQTAAGKYIVTVKRKSDRLAILNALGYSEDTVAMRINFRNFESKSHMTDEDTSGGVFGAFVRGAFLSAGIVTDPSKSYQLEFTAPTTRIRTDFVKIFDEFDDIVPRTADRETEKIVYFKNSSMIEDLLTIMGATNSTLELIGHKIRREKNNNSNRQSNFVTANIDRSITASAKQAEAVKVIASRIGLDSLPEELQETAELRLAHPTLSLSEIGRMLSSPISRSGLCHRMKRIMETADELKNNA